jgi:hypothetical protein
LAVKENGAPEICGKQFRVNVGGIAGLAYCWMPKGHDEPSYMGGRYIKHNTKITVDEDSKVRTSFAFVLDGDDDPNEKKKNEGDPTCRSKT